jgi:hypothetical protein
MAGDWIGLDRLRLLAENSLTQLVSLLAHLRLALLDYTADLLSAAKIELGTGWTGSGIDGVEDER